MDKIPILLLAAGSSSRMGRPKQLLSWGEQTLIEHQIQTFLKSGQPVNVVLGAHSELIIPLIQKFNVTIFINKNWETGMGSSIALGVQQVLKKSPKTKGILITLADQPLVTSAHITNMLQSFQPGFQQIVVSLSSSGYEGVPVLFDRFYFEELQKLNAGKGAKVVFQKHKNSVLHVNCGEILEDIDTPESYQRLLDKQTHT